MNAKKVKAVRRALKAKGFDFRDAKDKITNEHTLFSYDVEGKVNGRTTAYTAVLFHCGRELYKQLKKVAA